MKVKDLIEQIRKDNVSGAASMEGVVNKIGSYGLAVLARARKVPFFTLCGSEKFLPRQFSKSPESELKDPREILERPRAYIGTSGYSYPHWGKGKDVFIYFNNDAEGWAVRNARTLQKLLQISIS